MLSTLRTISLFTAIPIGCFVLYTAYCSIEQYWNTFTASSSSSRSSSSSSSASSSSSSSSSLSSPSSHPSSPLRVSSLLDFFLILGKLKTEKRTGWVARNVNLPESVADHQMRMAMMAMSLPEESYSSGKEQKNNNNFPSASPRDHCIKMCLIHDLAEAEVGDILPEEFSHITKKDKRKMERDAIITMCNNLSVSSVEISNEIQSLYFEYEEGKSDIARLVKQIDRAEMIIQAYEYEKKHNEKHKIFPNYMEKEKDKDKEGKGAESEMGGEGVMVDSDHGSSQQSGKSSLTSSSSPPTDPSPPNTKNANTTHSSSSSSSSSSPSASFASPSSSRSPSPFTPISTSPSPTNISSSTSSLPHDHPVPLHRINLNEFYSIVPLDNPKKLQENFPNSTLREMMIHVMKRRERDVEIPTD